LLRQQVLLRQQDFRLLEELGINRIKHEAPSENEGDGAWACKPSGNGATADGPWDIVIANRGGEQ